MDSQKEFGKCYNWFRACVRDRMEMNWRKDEINGIEEDRGKDDDDKSK